MALENKVNLTSKDIRAIKQANRRARLKEEAEKNATLWQGWIVTGNNGFKAIVENEVEAKSVAKELGWKVIKVVEVRDEPQQS